MASIQNVRASRSHSLEIPSDLGSNFDAAPLLPDRHVHDINYERNSCPQEQSPSEIASTSQKCTLQESSPAAGGRRHHRPWAPVVRTLPGWIRSVDAEINNFDATTKLLPSLLEDAVVAQHNHSPSLKQKPNSNIGEADGEQFETATPHRESRWRQFLYTVAYPPEPDLREQKAVTLEWLNENYGDYLQPYSRSKECTDIESRRKLGVRQKVWIVRFQENILKSPIVPLIFRLIVWIFSLIALALGASISHFSHKYDLPQGPSANIAIIVDAVALVYLIYTIYDEYMGKPLGLRSARAKMRLIFLDIFFIVFDSANLSLAFGSLSDVHGSCTQSEVNNHLDLKSYHICYRQKALASVLLVALIAWLSTFAVSVFRLVERVAPE